MARLSDSRLAFKIFMVYYNEFEPYPALWIYRLMKAGELPAGKVDCRDLRSVYESDLEGAHQAHFFAGIGGWAKALDLAGWPRERAVWTGSCPCQPFSCAGKHGKENDSRHLWPDFYELIKIGKPPVVFGEQVASADGREWLVGVRTDMEALGYAFGAADLCAAGVKAPHIWQRLYWVAYAKNASKPKDKGTRQSTRQPRRGCRVIRLAHNNNTSTLPSESAIRSELGNGGRMGHHHHHQRSQGRGRFEQTADKILTATTSQDFWESYELVPCRDGVNRRIEPGTLPLASRVSRRVEQITAYGNSIVPQVGALFIKAFLGAEHDLLT